MTETMTDDATPQVDCVVTGRRGEALTRPPYPGELGQRIVDNVSREGWQQWLQHLAMVINENGVNTAEQTVMPFIEEHMRGFFFHEGAFSGDNRFRPPNPIDHEE